MNERNDTPSSPVPATRWMAALPLVHRGKVRELCQKTRRAFTAEVQGDLDKQLKW